MSFCWTTKNNTEVGSTKSAIVDGMQLLMQLYLPWSHHCSTILTEQSQTQASDNSKFSPRQHLLSKSSLSESLCPVRQPLRRDSSPQGLAVHLLNIPYSYFCLEHHLQICFVIWVKESCMAWNYNLLTSSLTLSSSKPGNLSKATSTVEKQPAVSLSLYAWKLQGWTVFPT